MLQIAALHKKYDSLVTGKLSQRELVIYEYAALGGIVFIALVLRFYRLGEMSFWIDELITIGAAQEIIARISEGDLWLLLSHPTTSLLIHGMVSIFGLDELTARLAPAIVGALSPIILYFPLKRYFGSIVALATGLLLAVSPWHLYWSQNARFYVVLLLFYTLALVVFYRGLEEDNPRDFVLFLILTGLAASERLLAFFIAPVLASYVILLWLLPIEKPRGLRIRNLLIIVAPALVLGLFFGWEFFQDIGNWTAIFFGRKDKESIQILQQFLSHVNVQTIAFAVLGGLYLLFQKERKGLFWGLSAVIPPLLAVLISFFQFVDVRYSFVSLVGWLVLASVVGKELIFGTKGTVRIFALTAVFLLLIFEPLKDNMQYYSAPYAGAKIGTRLNWKAAFAYLEAEREPGEILVTNKPEMADYYLREEVPGMAEILPSISPDAIVNRGERAWFVIGGLSRVDEAYYEWIQENCELVYNDYAYTHIFLYQPDAAGR